jgi:DNA-directed RNA polymerase specialized sigma24 family protein
MARPKRVQKLTKSAVAKFLTTLDPNPVIAEERYEQVHRRLVKFFECNNCSDPEHATDITIDRAICKIDNGATVPNVGAFLFGIARHVVQEQIRDTPPHVILCDNLAAQPDDGAEFERRVQCLDACLQKLKPELRDLFVSYYGDGDRQELPSRFATTMNALRIRVFQIRNGLRQCVSGCMASS